MTLIFRVVIPFGITAFHVNALRATSLQIPKIKRNVNQCERCDGCCCQIINFSCFIFNFRLWSSGCRSRYQGPMGRLKFLKRPFCIIGEQWCQK